MPEATWHQYLRDQVPLGKAEDIYPFGQAGALCKRKRRWLAEQQSEARYTSRIEDLVIEDGEATDRAVPCN